MAVTLASTKKEVTMGDGPLAGLRVVELAGIGRAAPRSDHIICARTLARRHDVPDPWHLRCVLRAPGLWPASGGRRGPSRPPCSAAAPDAHRACAPTIGEATCSTDPSHTMTPPSAATGAAWPWAASSRRSSPRPSNTRTCMIAACRCRSTASTNRGRRLGSVALRGRSRRLPRG